MPKAEEAIVLVGGLGTRLRGVVPDLPKPLAPVAGRPFLAHLLDQLSIGGIRRVILATGYLAEKVEQAIGARWRDMDVSYSREEEPLGTGGAIRQAAELLHGDAVHLANGDTFLRFDFAKLENCVNAQQLSIGIALAWVPDVGRYGAVEVREGLVTAFREKGGQGAGYINAGSYFLTQEGIASLPVDRNYSFETVVLQPEALAGRVAAYGDSSDFIDIGVPDDYARAQHMFAEMK
ncbi:D-glycero-D-manno-heptose 1-phosphate guanosyltransferase [Dyella lipolytica]|uniref:Nucleotidyltransferase family protein n=1 Tax=Dyella lipolytica TaxID=1867835 RepID=A0ABW8IXZ2_9GAMM|nr:nucleotidyltransferase family protein [Dyella lipolytica]GLQ48022.1 D-glycero-D-manno-heptose 1-phosphate guanosyltransferase [Dyella lipolytica]